MLTHMMSVKKVKDLETLSYPVELSPPASSCLLRNFLNLHMQTEYLELVRADSVQDLIHSPLML